MTSPLVRIENIFFSLILLLLSISCSTDSSSEDEITQENLQPSTFEISITDDSYLTATISWSQSFDPENGSVLYNVIIDDTVVAQGLSDRVFNFENLVPSTSYSINVVAYDSELSERLQSITLTTTGNSSPLPFEILDIEVSNVSASIFWEDAIDPENDTVLYNVVLEGNTVIEGLSNTFHTIENLQPNQLYEGLIVAVDSEGNATEINFTFTTPDGIFNGDVSFYNQEDLVSFANAGWIGINGNLSLGSPGTTTIITDLSPLGAIENIQGNVSIWSVEGLSTIDGFSPQTIGGSLRIESNPNLETIQGFSTLTLVTNNVVIKANPVLITINSFENVTIIGGPILIDNNFILSEISAFNNLTSVNSIRIELNSELLAITGFSNLVSLENTVTISDSPNLSSITAFTQLESSGDLTLINLGIEHVDSFNMLKTVREQLFIGECANLIDITGLSNFESVTFEGFGSFVISNNEELSTLNGLESLIEIAGFLSINENPQLSNFCALENLLNTDTPSNFDIYQNLFNPTIQDILDGNCTN